MIVFSFDCAIKNLGFCCIEIDLNWESKIKELTKELLNFYKTYDSHEDPLAFIKNILTRIDNVLDNAFKIKYMNIIDLVPEGRAKDTKFTEVVKRLKYILYCLQQQLPTPDFVLIEYQMNANDKSRGISRYIEEYFLPLGNTDATITYAMTAYPLNAIDIPLNLASDTKIYIVTPNLKNSYQVSSLESLNYQTFIEKYNRNYDANKAHAVSNFEYFISSRNLDHTIKKIPNKLDDIADAFMMAYSWARHEKYI